LYFPVIRSRLAVADYLLAHGADPNAASPDGITPLYGAIMFNQPQMVLWLLEHGAHPNPKYEGKTPLTMALEKKQDLIVEILRAHGGAE
jgi:ankyrin repeat protein